MAGYITLDPQNGLYTSKETTLNLMATYSLTWRLRLDRV
jgi:hypothetical protein